MIDALTYYLDSLKPLIPREKIKTADVPRDPEGFRRFAASNERSGEIVVLDIDPEARSVTCMVDGKVMVFDALNGLAYHDDSQICDQGSASASMTWRVAMVTLREFEEASEEDRRLAKRQGALEALRELLSHVEALGPGDFFPLGELPRPEQHFKAQIKERIEALESSE